MTEDRDHAGKVVAGAVRVALTAAGQLAEQAARRREADLREAERDSATRVATLQSQLAAERELALRSVRDVVERGDATSFEEVVLAWEQARSWNDPAMATERARLEHRIQERFGVDARNLAAHRLTVDQSTAARLVALDIESQAGAAHHRGAAQNRSAVPADVPMNIGIHGESAAARALAAKSHPAPVRQAAQPSQSASGAKPGAKRRGRAVELQGPGR